MKLRIFASALLIVLLSVGFMSDASAAPWHRCTHRTWCGSRHVTRYHTPSVIVYTKGGGKTCGYYSREHRYGYYSNRYAGCRSCARRHGRYHRSGNYWN